MQYNMLTISVSHQNLLTLHRIKGVFHFEEHSHFSSWDNLLWVLKAIYRRKRFFNVRKKHLGKIQNLNVLLQSAINTKTKSQYCCHALRSGTYPLIKYLFSALRNRHGLIERLLTRDRSLSRGAVTFTLFIVISFMYFYEKKKLQIILKSAIKIRLPHF